MYCRYEFLNPLLSPQLILQEVHEPFECIERKDRYRYGMQVKYVVEGKVMKEFGQTRYMKRNIN